MRESVDTALLARADRSARAVRALPPRGALAREMRAIRRAEIFWSTNMAGSALAAADVDALLDRGRAQGGHALDDYILVRAYADAAAWVAESRSVPPGDGRSLLGVDELRQLNARATAGSGIRGGAWRQSNFAGGAGIVAPAAWLVAREVTTLVDRVARGPQDDYVAAWLAGFVGRFARISPFEGGNGRTVRLAANMLLRRLDYPPLVFDGRVRKRYPAAVAAAETKQPARLAALIAAAVVQSCDRLAAAGAPADGAVLPLRDAAGSDYTALAKAAQRGRLRTIVRGGRYFTTRGWIDDYRAGRARLIPSRGSRPPVRPDS